MNINTFFSLFGFNPGDFVEDEQNEPILMNDGYVIDLTQKVINRKCPNCGKEGSQVHGYYTQTINLSTNSNIRYFVNIKKPRLYCKKCGHTFINELIGLHKKSFLTDQQKQFIYNDFLTKLTFKEIGRKYNCSTARIIQLFDEKVKFVPRIKLPRVLCIDEIRFNKNEDTKFACILSDFEKSELIDILKSRTSPYLDEYFSSIKDGERKNVQIFISDMFDGYANKCRKFFPKAIHIVDLFHVVSQLTNAVNRLRTRAMNSIEDKSSGEYKFMKSHWKYFLCRKSNIPYKLHTNNSTGEILSSEQWIYRCLVKFNDLSVGYDCLQELYKYNYYHSYDESLNFVERISNRLINTGNEILASVGRTYHKWRYEISNGFTKGCKPFFYTNGKAEALNNSLKTIKKSAYGYVNFERFRKRALLIMSYMKR